MRYSHPAWGYWRFIYSAYTLFVTALVGHDTMLNMLPIWLDPHALLGFDFGDSLVHGVFWSLGLNTIGFVVASIRSPERLRDRIQAAAFVGENASSSGLGAPSQAIQHKVTPDGLEALAPRFLRADAVTHAFDEFATELGVDTQSNEPADWRLVQRTERLLASALGGSSARVVMSSAIAGADVALGDVLSILDQHTQALLIYKSALGLDDHSAA